MDNVIDSGSLNLLPPQPKEQEYSEVIPYVEEVRDPSKTGPSPKKLVAVEVLGYEVGRGLRKKVVSPEDVYKLAALGMSNREIARWFDIDHQVVNYNFQTIIDKGREDMKTSLRRAMIKNALSGNASLQIFLAKNMLGMSDNPTQTEDKKPLPWSEE
jgi:hypothetical protein